MNMKKIIMSLSLGMIVGVFSVLPSFAATSTIVVTDADMVHAFPELATKPDGWFFYDDEVDQINGTLGSLVSGPDTPPAGIGSAQTSVSGTQRRNLATYRFHGTVLADITELKFSTYNPSVGNGGSVNRSGYLNFNVDFDGSDTWQRRLVYVPSRNGTVVQDSWQEWDAIDGGDAKWLYSGPTWPVTNEPGTTFKTWDQILSDYPGVRMRINDPWFGIRVGEPYADGYTENIDKVVFGTAQDTTIFDFELNAPTVSPTVTVAPTATLTPTPNPLLPEACSGIDIDGEVIIGSGKSEKLNGTNKNDLILGKGGSDVIHGNGGEDCIVGGNGSDVLYGDNGNDVVLGEGDSDSMYGGNGKDTLIGGEGWDTARGEAGTQDTCVAEAKATCEL